MDQDQIKKTGVEYLGQASKFSRTECDNSSVLQSAIYEQTLLYVNLLSNASSSFDKSDIKTTSGIKPYSDDSDTGNWITWRNLVPIPLYFYHS
jgi:hypothetical protein